MNLRYFFIVTFIVGIKISDNSRLFAQKVEYPDYGELTESMERQLGEFFALNSELDIRQLQNGLLSKMNVENTVSLPTMPASRTQKLSGTELYRLCKQSTLMVCWKKKKGKCRFSATAVALTHDGVCTSNYHVFAELILSSALNGTFQENYLSFVMLPDGHAYPVKEILAADPINDFVLFQVETGNDRLVPMPLGQPVAEGEDVYCLSHPQGYLYSLTKGIVSRNYSKVNRDNLQMRTEMQITADYAIGSSGGPIIDECGNLVGLVSSTHSVYADSHSTTNFQMSIKNAIPVKLIRDCIVLGKMR